MLKKKFFAKALAFAMATGLLATAAPVGAAAPVVQVMAAAVEATNVAVTSDGDGVTATGANSVATTYTFSRTSEIEITVTATNPEDQTDSVDAYYSVTAATATDAPAASDTAAWDKLGASIAVLEALKNGPVKVWVSKAANSNADAVAVTVAAFPSSGSGTGGTTTPGTLTAEVDYETYSLQVTGGKYVFVDVLKASKKGETTTYKKSNTYAYTTAEEDITIDLSFLKASAENYIRVYTIGEDPEKVMPTPITIAKQPDKSAIKYVAGKPTLAESFTIKKGKNDVKVDATVLEKYVYRTMSGSTTEEKLSEFDLETAAVAGTTIIVREAAKETTKDSEGAPAGAEVKVKIAANPKAPKVAIDYVKELVTLPKDSFYRIITETVDADATDKWVKVSEGAKKSPADLAKDYGTGTKENVTEADAAKGYTLVVYTQKTNKAASSPAYVTIAGQPEVEQTVAGTVTVKGDTATGDKAKKLVMKTEGEGKNAKAIFTAYNADFTITVGSKTSTVKASKSVTVKQTDSAQDVTVKLAGVKPTTKAPITPGSFPSSNAATVKVPAVAKEDEPEKKATITAAAAPASVAAPSDTTDAVIMISVTGKKADGNAAAESDITSLTYSITGRPSGVAESDDKVVFDGTNKSKLLVKKDAGVGEYTITVSAKIGEETVTAEVKVTVTAANPSNGG